MPALHERVWTADEVRALPDVPETRLEVVDGALLVSPGPGRQHQVVLSRLFTVLTPYVDEHSLGLLL